MSDVINDNKKHALLSASGASRWISCPPSARLEEQLPEKTSTYADEGNLAHDIAELKLKKAFTDPAMSTRKFNAEMKKLQAHELYQEEMQGYTNDYAEYITQRMYGFEIKPYIAVEAKVDFSSYVQEGFGTADCIIISENFLYVTDFKYGKGVEVSAEDNAQMMLYALGAYLKYSFLYPIEHIQMTIAQPRLDNFSEYSLSVTELLDWAENKVRPAAQSAFRGGGEFVAGEHCKFCRAKAQCRARADQNLALEGFTKKLPPIISNDEVGEYLLKAQDLAKWAKDLEEYTLAALLKGDLVKGWKAVEGRSNRQITNTDEAFKKLTDSGYKEEMLYERKPITLTAIEKLVGGKKTFNELLAEYVIKPQGKPTLALESDKREPYSVSTTATEDFKAEGGELTC